MKAFTAQAGPSLWRQWPSHRDCQRTMVHVHSWQRPHFLLNMLRKVTSSARGVIETQNEQPWHRNEDLIGRPRWQFMLSPTAIIKETINATSSPLLPEVIIFVVSRQMAQVIRLERNSMQLSLRSCFRSSEQSYLKALSIMLQILHRFHSPSGMFSNRGSHPAMGNCFVARSFATVFQSQSSAENVMFDSLRRISMPLVSKPHICGCKLPVRRLSRQNVLLSGSFAIMVLDVRRSLMTD